MKKTLLTLLLCVLTVSAFALGDNSGESRANATDFDWNEAYARKASKDPWWFRIDITDVKAMENPTLALYITNGSQTQAATVAAALFIESSNTAYGEDERLIGAGEFTIKSQPMDILTFMGGVQYVYLRMKVTGTTDSVFLSAKAIETARADLACKTNTTISIDGPQVAGTAGETKWFNFDIQKYQDDSKQLRVIITPDAPTTINTSLSYDCPCTGSTDASDYIATGSKEILISGTVLQTLSALRAYLSVNAGSSYKIQVVEETVTTPPTTTPVASIDTIRYDLDNPAGYPLTSGDNWFVFEYDSIIQNLLIPNVMLSAGDGATVTAYLGYKDASGNIREMEPSYDWSFTGTENVFPLDVNILTDAKKSIFKDGVKYYVYYRINTTASDLNFKMVVTPLPSGKEDCDSYKESGEWTSTSTELDYNLYLTDHFDDHTGKINLKKFKDFTINGHQVDIEVTLADKSGSANSMKVALVNCESALSENSYTTRSLGAGESKTKLIRYSQYSVYEDEVLFRIKATGKYKLTFTAVEAIPEAVVDSTICTTSTDFDWRYGHNIAAGSDQWFAIDLDTVHNTSYLPVLSIRNDGDAKANVKIQYAYDCAVTYALPDPEAHSVAVGKTYTDTLTRESLLGITGKKLWVRVITNQKAYFSIMFNKPQNYADRFCEGAIDFNWEGGNRQADTTLWYAIDLSHVKPSKKIIHLHIKNEGAVSSDVTADIAFSCPYANTTHYHTVIPAGTTKNAPALSYINYEKNDMVWVRLKSVGSKIFFWADLEEDTFTPINVCSNLSAANQLHINDTIKLTSDSVWYWFDVKEMDSFDPSYVPQVSIENPTDAAITAKIYSAYHCEITSSMMERSQRFGKHSIYTKAIEHDMRSNYIDNYDSIIVCVVGAKGLNISAAMIDPNLGADCSHAISFQYGTSSADKRGHKQAAGQDMWYKLKVADAKGKIVKAGIANLTASTVKANVGLYLSCEGKPVQAGSRNLSASSNPEREIGELLNGLSAEYIFLNVNATDSVHVYAYFDGDLPTGPEINVCDTPMIKVETGVHYYQGASTYAEGVWYYVDVALLDTTTKGDAKITITPKGTTPVTMKAELYWACHTTDLPTTKTQTISTAYTKTLTRETIETMAKDSAFIRIQASDSIDFIIELESLLGVDCMNPKEFDWEYCNTQAGGDWVWYHINLDSLKANQDKDLSLTIENLEHFDVDVEVDSILLSCGASPLMTVGKKTLKADSIRHQYVDNSLLSYLSIDKELNLKIKTTGQVRICPELVEALGDSIARDTIRRDICFGGDFLDPNFPTNPDSVNVHNHTHRNIEENFFYSDTVGFRYDGTFHGDSIRWYEIHVLKDPILPQHADSSTFHTLVLEQGKGVTKQLLDSIIKDVYDSIKAMTDVTLMDTTKTITWEASTTLTNNKYLTGYAPLTEDPTDAFISGMGLVFTAKTTCESEISDTLVLSFTKNSLDTLVTIADTLCAGAPFTDPVSAKVYTINADTAIFDTVRYYNSALKQNGDTIYKYDFKVFTYTYTAGDGLSQSDYPTMKAGKGLDYAAAEVVLKNNFKADNSLAPAINSVVWSYSVANEKSSPYYATSGNLSATGADSAWVAFEMTTDCGNVIRDTFHIGLEKADTLQYVFDQALCFGETIHARGGDTIVNAAAMEWTYTVHDVEKLGVSDQHFDSIYTYKVTSIVPVRDTINHVMCQGETFTWCDTVYATSQVDHYRVIPVKYTSGLIGCDSVSLFLNLTVNPTYDTIITDTICMAESTYEWIVSDGTDSYNPYKANTYDLETEGAGLHTYTQTLKTVHGCDSVITLHLTIGEEFDGGTFTDYACLGKNYPWLLSPTDTMWIPAPATVGSHPFEKTYTTMLGCDSTYKLNLIVVDTLPIIHPHSVCYGETFTWDENGEDYTPSDYDPVITDPTQPAVFSLRYTYPSGRVMGQRKEALTDSVAILKLTINPVFSFYDTIAICDNKSRKWQGMTLTAADAGDTVQNYQTIQECDSTYHLHLIVVNTPDTIVMDTICKNDPIDLGQNGGLTNITTSGDYIEMRETTADTCHCDSTITHRVWVRTLPELPAVSKLDTVPQLVCGDVPQLDNINAAIHQWIDQNVTPENEQIVGEPIWQIYDDASKSWKLLSDSDKVFNRGVDEQLRYSVVTGCGSVIELKKPYYSVPVEMPSTDNIYSLLNVEVLSKYDNWLLIINLNKVTAQLKAKGFPQPTEEQVIWYVDADNNGPDRLNAEGKPTKGDREVGRGYYYTEDKQLVGTYYAVIYMEKAGADDKCGLSLRSVVLTCGNGKYSETSAANNSDNSGSSIAGTDIDDSSVTVGTLVGRPDFKAPVISPTLVRAGGMVYVYNLNPEITTTIEVYNLMGERVDAVKVSGVDTYGYTTSDLYTGYFMMNISSEEDTRALKYIAK